MEIKLWIFFVVTWLLLAYATLLKQELSNKKWYLHKILEDRTFKDMNYRSYPDGWVWIIMLFFGPCFFLSQIFFKGISSIWKDWD